MEIKDEKINDLLKRTKEYRKNLSNSKFNTFEDKNFKDKDFGDLGDIFKSFFENAKENFDMNDKDNIYLKCKISKDKALEGCMKKIKYKQINQKGIKEIKKIDLKIPSNIKDSQSIVLHNEGNYIKEKNVISDVVVEIKVK